MKKLIYTDGASSGNPGPGGYAAVITDGKTVIEVGDGEPMTTNNRMELKAAIEGLKQTEVGDSVKVITDSKYLATGITEWITGWVQNNWQTKNRTPVSNKDLWMELYDLTVDRDIEWMVVKGHTSTAGNNRVDAIASTFAGAIKPQLYNGPKSGYPIDLTEPTPLQINADYKMAKTDGSRKGTKAYSYLSLVNGKLEKHRTWGECEERVKGKAGAKFRKTLSPEDESEIIRSWGLGR